MLGYILVDQLNIFFGGEKVGGTFLRFMFFLILLMHINPLLVCCFPL